MGIHYSFKCGKSSLKPKFSLVHNNTAKFLYYVCRFSASCSGKSKPIRDYLLKSKCPVSPDVKISAMPTLMTENLIMD